MGERSWVKDRNRNIICLDSYHNGVPQGRIYHPSLGMERFCSLSEFLIKMEAMLDELQMPQSYTAVRTFRPVHEPLETHSFPARIPKGTKATFALQVSFRQHTSWQGVIIWLEQQLEQSFRSALELVLLMDSALRDRRGCDSA